MLLTVKDVLDFHILRQCNILTAHHTLEHRVVSGISVIEMAVEHFVKKDEMVLTTGIGFRTAPDQFISFIQEVYKSRASALIIATGKYIDDVPVEVIQFAEENQFPIIEIPWEIRFSEVIQLVLSKVHDWQQYHDVESIQKQLIQLFIHNSDLSAVADVITGHIHSPTLIIDQDGYVEGTSQKAGQLKNTWNNFLNRAPNQFLDQLERVYHQSNLTIYYKQWDQERLLLLPIHHLERCPGYLVFTRSSSHYMPSLLSDQQLYLLEQSMPTITLWFQKRQIIEETESRLRGDFVWRLAKGSFDSWEVALSQAKSLRYQINLPYVCILGLPEKLEDLFQSLSYGAESYDKWLQTFFFQIEQKMLTVADSLNLKLMVTFQSGRFIIYLETLPDNAQQTVQVFLDQLEPQIRTLAPHLIISWGIGENYVGVNTFSKSFQDAEIALHLGRNHRGIGYRNRSINLYIYQVLESIADQEEIRKIAFQTIHPLVHYSNQRGIDLIQTLTHYIHNKGNVSQTARKTNLHRQSLLYRLQKIESLTGRSLINPDDLFLLDLSIRLFSTGLLHVDGSS